MFTREISNAVLVPRVVLKAFRVLIVKRCEIVRFVRVMRSNLTAPRFRAGFVLVYVLGPSPT